VNARSAGRDGNRLPFTLSLCNEVVREMSFAAQCDMAAALGYEAIEIAPFTLTEDPRSLSDKRLGELRRAAEATGIRVSSLHWLLMAPAGLSITAADAKVRATTFEVMEALVNVCAALGGQVLVHGSPGQRVLTEADPLGDAQRGVEAFAAAAQFAEQAGVVYCIEPLSPHETAFVNTVAQAERIVVEVGNAHLRTMLDTRAATLTESEPPAVVLARGLAAGTIAHVHFNDSSKLGPGQGDDEFLPVVETLLRSGYTGTVAIEPFEYVPDGRTAAAFAAGYVSGLVEALRAG